MKRLQVRNGSRGTTLGGRILWADGMLTRMRGFLMRPEPQDGEGLLLSPCRGVHMYGMRFPLDVLFLDRGGTVLSAFDQLAPGERTPLQRGARHALELPAGTLKRSGTRVGDQIEWSVTR